MLCLFSLLVSFSRISAHQHPDHLACRDCVTATVQVQPLHLSSASYACDTVLEGNSATAEM